MTSAPWNSCARSRGTRSLTSTRSWAATTSPRYQAEAPGCYAFIGAGGEYPHHHPRFRIDERALPIGTRLHVDVALRALEVYA